MTQENKRRTAAKNHSEKRGGPPTEQCENWREKTSSNSCRKNASLLFRSAKLHSAGEKLKSLIQHQHISPVKMNIIPDSGASICLAGPQHIAKFNLDTHNLITCYKQIKAVGGSKLICHGWLPITFRTGKNTTKQPVYICDKVDRFYFGKKRMC